MSAPTLQAVARAAFMVADREHQAALDGREYSLDDSRAVAEACGVEATRLALVMRAEMQQHEVATLQAFAAIKHARGSA